MSSVKVFTNRVDYIGIINDMIFHQSNKKKSEALRKTFSEEGDGTNIKSFALTDKMHKCTSISIHV